MYVYIYIYIYIYIHLHMHIYIYIYTHIHMVYDENYSESFLLVFSGGRRTTWPNILSPRVLRHVSLVRTLCHSLRGPFLRKTLEHVFHSFPISLSLYISIYLSLSLSIYIYMCLYAYVCTYICTYIHIYIYIHTLYIYIYTHTYMFTYTHKGCAQEGILQYLMSTGNFPEHR